MDRLTAQDLSMLWPDRHGWPQDIGAIMFLEGGRLLDRDGRFRIEYARRVVEDRLARVGRFRQVLLVPRRGLGWPLWVDAPVVDLAHHVRVLPLEAPGDERAILRAVERLRRRPLDRSRPLWEMWFLTGMPDDRVALYVRAHHSIADGVAGVAMLGAFLQAEPTAPPTDSPRWAAQPPPSGRDLLLDNVQRRLRELAGAVSAMRHLPTRLRGLRSSLPALREVLATGNAPRTSINRPIGAGRRVALVRSDLGVVKQVAHGHDATVNDVLMAAMAGGLRSLLQGRGEPISDVVLRAYVPVALHRELCGEARGNADGMMVIGLPVGIADPVARLRRIAAETVERRKLRRPSGGSLLRFSLLQRAMLGLMARQRWANVYAADVPGPPTRLHFAEAPVIEMFPLVPLIGNVTLGVGALSYAGQFAITVVGDERACPDLDVFVTGMETSLRSFARSLSTAGSPLAARG